MAKIGGFSLIFSQFLKFMPFKADFHFFFVQFIVRSKKYFSIFKINVRYVYNGSIFKKSELIKNGIKTEISKYAKMTREVAN